MIVGLYSDLRNPPPFHRPWAQRYEQAKAAMDTAQAQLAAAEADARVAENEAAYAVLLADADGTVVEMLGEALPKSALLHHAPNGTRFFSIVKIMRGLRVAQRQSDARENGKTGERQRDGRERRRV